MNNAFQFTTENAQSLKKDTILFFKFFDYSKKKKCLYPVL